MEEPYLEGNLLSQGSALKRMVTVIIKQNKYELRGFYNARVARNAQNPRGCLDVRHVRCAVQCKSLFLDSLHLN